jgi:murein DD-endopeptidase MepM/ murein hydrolase activator NlpD
MLRLFCVAGAFALALAASASAQQMVSPTGQATISSTYFDRGYLDAERRQHLGIDFPAEVGAAVYAPVEGDVVVNNTDGSDARDAYLVIRMADGVEIVVGYISSSVAVGAHVMQGKNIGTVRAYPSNSPLSGRTGASHVHLGVNRTGVEQTLRGDWEWARGPQNTSRSQAARRGWVDPMNPNQAAN